MTSRAPEPMDAKTLPDSPPRTLPESESAEWHVPIIPAFDEQVTDTEHRIHQLGPILAEGGQGAVYSTTFAEVAVKLLRGGRSVTELVDTIGAVSRLPIRDLPIAMPYSVTREWPGYVMTMVRGMEPVGHLRKHSPRSIATSLEWYARTGGLRRRIAVLARDRGPARIAACPRSGVRRSQPEQRDGQCRRWRARDLVDRHRQHEVRRRPSQHPLHTRLRSTGARRLPAHRHVRVRRLLAPGRGIRDNHRSATISRRSAKFSRHGQEGKRNSTPTTGCSRASSIRRPRIPPNTGCLIAHSCCRRNC